MPAGQPPGQPVRTPAVPGSASAVPGSAPAVAVVPFPHDGISRDWHAAFPLSLRLTLLVHRRGPGDPAFRIDDRGAIWRTSLTPAGPGTLRLVRIRPDAHAGAAADTGDLVADALAIATARPADPTIGATAASAPAAGAGLTVRATAWGDGAAWLLDTLPDLLGASDDPAAFQPAQPRLRDLVRQLSGLRISRTARVLEALVPAVLEQKVVSIEAHRAWRRLLTWHGSPAPGPAPAGMRVVPSAAAWQAIPSWDWHRAGVEAVRARTIANAARVASRLEDICLLPAAEADRRLRSLAGIGPWTSAEVRQRACGDPDAVSVGDYHIPSLVGWTLTGEVTDDEGMLELLAPYAGQRYRATRLIELGSAGPPRRGPRMSVRDYRGI